MHPQLFADPPLPRVRRTDPITSVNGAKRASVKAPSRRSRILEALAVRPMTDDEICHALGEHPRWWPSVKSARTRLANVERLVVATAQERKGQTVWTLA